MFGGAIVTGILWFVVNGFFRENGVGWLARLGWPWSSILMMVLAGVLLGLIAETIRWKLEVRHGQSLADWAGGLGLEYAQEVVAEDVADWRGLPLFRKSPTLRHRSRGTYRGADVEMFDGSYVERGSENDTTHTLTAAFLDTGDPSLPRFELHPRDRGMQILAAMSGYEGIQFDATHARLDDAAAIEKFTRHYFLTTSLADDLVGMLPLKPPAPEAATLSAQQLFSRPVLEFFGDHPNWHVESHAGRLVIWRSGTARPSQRSKFLDTLVALRDVLAARRTSAPASALPLAPPSHPAAMKAQIAGTIVGVFGGFFGGGITGGILAVTFVLGPQQPTAGSLVLAAALFFGGAIGGLALGAAFGSRVIGRLFASFVPRSAPPAGLDKSTAGTTTLDEQAGQLTIDVAPPGLFAGSGCFLCLWSAVWNSMLLVMTPLFLSQAWAAGQAGPGGAPQGNEMSFGVTVLFLVPFWAAGLGTVAFVVHRARRRTILTLNESELAVESRSPLSRSRKVWPCDRLASVHVIGSGLIKPQLVIESRDGHSQLLLAGTDHAELVQIAEAVTARLSSTT